MIATTSLIVNENKLPSTVKRLFRNSVDEIIGELLQNAQRAGATRIDFEVNEAEKIIVIADDGSGIAPDAESWARVLRMADSFYSNASVEDNQKPMGLGLLSLFALEAVTTIEITSHARTVTIDARALWETGDYWASWTNLIKPAPAPHNGFKLVVQYEDSSANSSYNNFARKFRYALAVSGSLGSAGAARGYAGILDVSLDGVPLDTSLPSGCIPSGVFIDAIYAGNRLRIGQNSHGLRNDEACVVWYGQIIKIAADIPFLLEVRRGSPVTPLAPTRSGLISDKKLARLQRFVESTVFAHLQNDSCALQMSPAFIEMLHRRYPARARQELAVCVVDETIVPANAAITGYDDFHDLTRKKVVSYREIELNAVSIYEPKIQFFLGTAEQSQYRNNFDRARFISDDANEIEYDSQTASPWGEASEGLTSFVSVLGGSICTLAAGDANRVKTKTVYWKPGAQIQSVFHEAGEFAVTCGDAEPIEPDFKPVAGQVFVFEYTHGWDVEDVEGLCVGVPVTASRSFADEAARWLNFYGKACYSPDDDFDYERQEDEFNRSITRLILELKKNVLSTNWNYDELKNAIERLLRDAKANSFEISRDRQKQPEYEIENIWFERGDNRTNLLITISTGQQIRLDVAEHTYLN